MPGGRPTKYNDEILEKSRDYLENFEKFKDVIPSIAGLACVLSVSRDTLHTWRKDPDKKEFSDILDDILSKQERTLVNKGLNGEFNSNIVKLTLGKHGYHDTQELMGKDGGAIEFTDTERAARLATLLDRGRKERDRQSD